MKKTLSAVVVLLILAGAGYFVFHNRETTLDIINPDDEENKIVVTSPIKDAEISSPLSIAGRARGMWFFEGSFPVELEDAQGNTIAEGHVSAQGEWMTEEFVPFLGTLQFNNYIKGQRGRLILKKDNPSGLPENDDSIKIPVIFK